MLFPETTPHHKEEQEPASQLNIASRSPPYLHSCFPPPEPGRFAWPPRRFRSRTRFTGAWQICESTFSSGVGGGGFCPVLSGRRRRSSGKERAGCPSAPPPQEAEQAAVADASGSSSPPPTPTHDTAKSASCPKLLAFCQFAGGKLAWSTPETPGLFQAPSFATCVPAPQHTGDATGAQFFSSSRHEVWPHIRANRPLLLFPLPQDTLICPRPAKPVLFPHFLSSVFFLLEVSFPTSRSLWVGSPRDSCLWPHDPPPLAASIRQIGYEFFPARPPSLPVNTTQSRFSNPKR